VAKGTGYCPQSPLLDSTPAHTSRHTASSYSSTTPAAHMGCARAAPHKEKAMQKIFGIVVALVLAVPAIATAGEKYSANVVINQNVPYANGSMGAARNSRDSNQAIGCYYTTNGPGKTAGYCWARDAAGTHAGCKWFDDSILEKVVATMTSDSFIHFNWDQYYMCTRITVQNASQYEPKK
jgi:hypothetical protein